MKTVNKTEDIKTWGEALEIKPIPLPPVVTIKQEDFVREFMKYALSEEGYLKWLEQVKNEI